MAEYRLPNGIRNFAPDNTPDTLHIQSFSPFTLGDLVSAAKHHFGEGIEMDDLHIEASNIHTRCLGYDQHDSDDYDDFIILSRKA